MTAARIINVNPIAIIPGYIFRDGLFFGINTDGISELQVSFLVNKDAFRAKLDNFFIKDRMLYFSFVDRWSEEVEIEVGGETHAGIEAKELKRCFSQEGSTVTEIAQLPAYPKTPERASCCLDDYNVEIYEWDNCFYSRIIDKKTKKIICNASSFDSFLSLNGAIYFTQKRKSVRESGLWYIDHTIRSGPIRLSEYSYIWKI